MCNPRGTVTLGSPTERFEPALGVGSELVVLMEDGGLLVEDEGLVVVVVEERLGCCRSTWPRSRVGSMMLRTSCLRCLTSVRVSSVRSLLAQCSWKIGKGVNVGGPRVRQRIICVSGRDGGDFWYKRMRRSTTQRSKVIALFCNYSPGNPPSAFRLKSISELALPNGAIGAQKFTHSHNLVVSGDWTSSLVSPLPFSSSLTLAA